MAAGRGVPGVLLVGVVSLLCRAAQAEPVSTSSNAPVAVEARLRELERQLDDADRNADRAMALRMPAYPKKLDDPTLRSVAARARVRTRWSADVKKKFEAVDAAARRYTDIVARSAGVSNDFVSAHGFGEPPADPRFQSLWIHASYRVGLLYDELVREVYAKIPGPTYKGPCYTDCPSPADVTSQFPREKTRGAMKTCVQWATHWKEFTDDALGCERWLGRHHEAGPALDELFPVPHWTGKAVSQPSLTVATRDTP